MGARRCDYSIAACGDFKCWVPCCRCGPTAQGYYLPGAAARLHNWYPLYNLPGFHGMCFSTSSLCAGQEECLICYSIIQPTNGQLPRLRCRTCSKRFHSSCLYRWFKTGKNTCPHCVSPW